MTHLRVPMIVSLAVLLAAAGCTTAEPTGAATGQPPDGTGAGTLAPPGPAADQRESPAVGLSRSGPDGPPGPGPGEYQVRYGWAVPSQTVVIRNDVRPPVASRPAPPLPYLVEIEATDHADTDPAYSRISFVFRSGFPSYEVGYQPRIVLDGTGEPVDLAGDCFLQIRFVSAQAHDAYGRMSIQRSPRPQLRLGSLRGYGFAGDYEGRVTYGLGLDPAGGPDQPPPVRVAEVGVGDRFIVAVDVRY
ncbi:hypothetical protein O7621_22845 [Solwaraspora sp. WMMD937]|uniref:AMIN-like domain-containing (lipo)protein n=1 Tax=Solwaraspora sp. WMMD937 TaxID=3016090 RepID=UPI00249B8845|nr:hypothetical protein [Solwaraspora sp. WMMD937]WFE20695.1 hypothetical protein O7621_22845 [Solwaraspora sp. WMMD937]